MAIGAAEYTELVASTWERIEGDLVDQVLTSHPTLDLFQSHAKSADGREMVLNLEGADDDSTAFTDASGTFPTTASNDVIGASKWDWSSPLVSKVRVQWLNLQKNSGKEQIVDLLKAHLGAAKKGHAKEIAKALHGIAAVADDSTENWTTSGGNTYVARGFTTGQFECFDRIVADGAYEDDPNGDLSGADSYTVGGISGTATPFWNASRLEIPLDHGTMGAGSIRKAFRHVRNELEVANSGQHRVSHVIAGREIYEEFVDSYDDKVRYPNPGGSGQAQFNAVMDGDIEVRLDPDCPPDRAYFLDIDAWRFEYLNGNWMKPMPAQTITGTLDFVTPLASVLSVGTNQRRANAVLLRPSTAGGDA